MSQGSRTAGDLFHQGSKHSPALLLLGQLAQVLAARGQGQGHSSAPATGFSAAPSPHARPGRCRRPGRYARSHRNAGPVLLQPGAQQAHGRVAPLEQGQPVEEALGDENLAGLRPPPPVRRWAWARRPGTCTSGCAPPSARPARYTAWVPRHSGITIRRRRCSWPFPARTRRKLRATSSFQPLKRRYLRSRSPAA